MIDDLKMIKDKYGENMMHLCRECFPTILETPGLLFTLLSNKFAYNKFLYEDIIKEGRILEFKNYIYSLIDVEKKEIIVDKSPKQLLEEAGYVLYECKTEEDIQKFKKYYSEKEELCTFKTNRLNNCYVFFAVKKNVDEIKRENFKNPSRQDEYGTSVISIQFSKGEKNTLSIKNRYNHRVNNPDATFNNNLDNIIEGLTESFNREYNLNINSNSHNNFELDSYVKANDGKYYKYNYEINNTYYCIDNIIIDNFEVIKNYQEKEKYLIFDYFILDLENKTIKLYDNLYTEDEFVNIIKNIKKIEITKEKNTKNKIIKLYFDNNKTQIIKINNKNQLIYYKNNYIYKIGNDFLHFNETLSDIEINNIVKIGNDFLPNNKTIESLKFPNLMEVGNDFLYRNNSIKVIDFPLLESVGNAFLCSTQILSEMNLQQLRKTGSSFLYNNLYLEEINLPNLIYAGNYFMYQNKFLSKIDMPKLKEVKDYFLFMNKALKNLNIPKIKIVGAGFLYTNLNYNSSLNNKIINIINRSEKIEERKLKLRNW